MAFMVRYRKDLDHIGGSEEFYFKKVEKPQPGDTICHGDFRPYTVDLDVGTETRYTPKGDYTTEEYSGDVERF
jgi:hypothetical protein